MTTHIMSLTYSPKIEAVFAKTCRQTIRKPNGRKPRQVGDTVLFHDWTGKPYRSKWGRRLKVELTEVLHIGQASGSHWWRVLGEDEELINGFVLFGKYFDQMDEQMDEIARLDGIVPATRAELEATLMGLNGLDSLAWTDWEVIRW